MIISGGIKDAIVGWLREQHLPFRIQEASRGVCTGKPQESKMILMDNYPPGFSFRARQQAPVKRTPVKSQAGRQPHLWIHCISRMTVISISHRDMAKKNVTCLSRNNPISAWLRAMVLARRETYRSFTIYVPVLCVGRSYLLVHRHYLL